MLVRRAARRMLLEEAVMRPSPHASGPDPPPVAAPAHAHEGRHRTLRLRARVPAPRRRRRPVRALVVLALVPAALVTAACGSQPDSSQGPVANPALGNSVNAQVGDIRLLATRIDAPE